MPVVGRGRGKFTTGKGKLFGGSGSAITTRDTQPSNGTSNGSNGIGGSTTDVWGTVHESNGNTDRFADPTKEVEVRFNVFNANLARIIGKGGSNINSIRDETSANIDIHKDESDGNITPVTLKGSQLNCDHAKRMIDEICMKFNGMAEGQDTPKTGGGSSGGGGFGSGFGGMSGAPADDGPTEDEDIFIPEDKCGRVIGRGGSKIQEIQDDSGCNVKVHGRETAEDGKVAVTLTGSASQRAKARGIIEGLTADRGGGGGGGGSNFVVLPDNAEPRDIWVESCRIGRVVGKGGSKIREIQDMFCVKVDISKDVTKDDDTLVVLTGAPESTTQAKDYIDELCERSSKPDNSGFDMGGGGGDEWGAPATNGTATQGWDAPAESAPADGGWGAAQPSGGNDGWGAAQPSGDNDGWGQVSGSPAW